MHPKGVQVVTATGQTNGENDPPESRAAGNLPCRILPRWITGICRGLLVHAPGGASSRERLAQK
jgi:hypothetical protein